MSLGVGITAVMWSCVGVFASFFPVSVYFHFHYLFVYGVTHQPFSLKKKKLMRIPQASKCGPQGSQTNTLVR